MGRDGRKKHQYYVTDDVSIHTPAWGATLRSIWHLSLIESFNPHARMGRDFDKDRSEKQIQVSIHTPAWGATGTADETATAVSFNPHARMGRDRQFELYYKQRILLLICAKVIITFIKTSEKYSISA